MTNTSNQGTNLQVGDTVTIYGGYNHKQIGEGKVIRLTKRFALVETSMYRVPVRYRLEGGLKGRRVTGGLVEALNDFILV